MKPIVVVVTPLTAIIFMKDEVVMTCFIRIKLRRTSSTYFRFAQVQVLCDARPFPSREVR